MRMSFCSLRLILENLFSLSKYVLNLLSQISSIYIELTTVIIETGSKPLTLILLTWRIPQCIFFFLFLFNCRYSHLYFYYPLTTCSILYISIGIGYRNNFTIHPCTPCIYCLSNKSLLKKVENMVSS